jgi:hypothetical protein
LNRAGHPGSPYTHLISPHCGTFFVPEGGGSRDSCLEGGEFELLIEIVNPVPAGTLKFRYYEERVTKEEVSPKAGQRPGKLVF